MYLFFHASVGALIGKYLSSPFLSFLLGCFSHFLLDTIPHGDKKAFKFLSLKEKFQNSLLIGSFDFSLTILLLVLIFHLKNFSHPLSLISGSLGSILPDFIWFFFLLNQKLKILSPKLIKPFKKYYTFHEEIHELLTKKDLSYYLGLSSQIILSLIIILIIIF